jgi:hypothetical protein
MDWGGPGEGCDDQALGRTKIFFEKSDERSGRVALLIKMQDRQIPIKRRGELFG